MNTFEFQFRWGEKRSSFGIDVNASTIEEAVAKANRFFDSDQALHPCNSPDAERMWINVTSQIVPRNIASIYGPLGEPECRAWSVAQWRKAEAKD
jgi:hypothetical protein